MWKGGKGETGVDNKRLKGERRSKQDDPMIGENERGKAVSDIWVDDGNICLLAN